MKQVLLLLGMSLTYADWFGGDEPLTEDTVPNTEDTEVADNNEGISQLLGDDSDENNCVTSEGEIWCVQQSRCLKPLEEHCDEQFTSLGDFLNSILKPADHIPDFENEGTLPESEGDESTDSPVIMVGGDRDDNDCITSAGYTWCEKKNECVRQWMLDGEWDDECTEDTTVLGGDKDGEDCIASAGYTWCEKQNICARSWELEGEWEDECTIATTSDISAGSSSFEGSSDKPGESESTQDDLAKFFYNEDGTIKPWVFKVFLGLSITAAVLLVCLIRARRLRKRRQRRRGRSAAVQMLATDTDNYARFNGDESNFVFQETVAVKTSGKDDVPNRREFTNLV